jgi:hypothetical protein
VRACEAAMCEKYSILNLEKILSADWMFMAHVFLKLVLAHLRKKTIFVIGGSVVQ